MIFSLSCNYNNYMTYNWPNSAFRLIFKRMQIKRIADNIRAFSFLLTNWNKEPDEERIYRWTEFFHKLDNNKKKMCTGARATKQNYISIYISLYMKTFLKTGVYISKAHETELWRQCCSIFFLFGNHCTCIFNYTHVLSTRNWISGTIIYIIIYFLTVHRFFSFLLSFS